MDFGGFQEMTIKIGVMGSVTDDDRLLEKARQIGRRAAEQGCVLITGGGPGLPLAAAKGAVEAGGLCLGISPAANEREHREKYGYPIEPYLLLFTGMGRMARNVLNIRFCDAVIFIDGRIGTLNEFTIIFHEGRPENVIGILSGSGGLADQFMNIVASTGRKTAAKIIQDPDPVSLLDRVAQAVQAARDAQGA